jgi:hypothetical protein
VRLTLAPPVMAPRRHQAGEPYQGMCVAEKVLYTPFSPLPKFPAREDIGSIIHKNDRAPILSVRSGISANPARSAMFDPE